MPRLLTLLLCLSLPFTKLAYAGLPLVEGNAAATSDRSNRQSVVVDTPPSTTGQKLHALGNDAAQFGTGLVTGVAGERSKKKKVKVVVDDPKNPKSSDALDGLFDKEAGDVPAPASEASAPRTTKASNSLDNLFDQETGEATPQTKKPTHATTKQKSKGLDSLLEQEQAEEEHQRQLAEEKRREEETKRKAEEERQRQLAEEKRRRDEAQRLAEQRQREIDDERERESREAQSTKDEGLAAFGLGVLTGNRNLATAGLQQTIDGKKTDFTGAYKQDLTEQKQRDDAEARRRDAEAARVERQHRLQEQAADAKVKEDTRQIEAYNRQQQQLQQQTSTRNSNGLQVKDFSGEDAYVAEMNRRGSSTPSKNASGGCYTKNVKESGPSCGVQ